MGLSCTTRDSSSRQHTDEKQSYILLTLFLLLILFPFVEADQTLHRPDLLCASLQKYKSPTSRRGTIVRFVEFVPDIYLFFLLEVERTLSKIRGVSFSALLEVSESGQILGRSNSVFVKA